MEKTVHWIINVSTFAIIKRLNIAVIVHCNCDQIFILNDTNTCNGQFALKPEYRFAKRKNIANENTTGKIGTELQIRG